MQGISYLTINLLRFRLIFFIAINTASKVEIFKELLQNEHQRLTDLNMDVYNIGSMKKKKPIANLPECARSLLRALSETIIAVNESSSILVSTSFQLELQRIQLENIHNDTPDDGLYIEAVHRLLSALEIIPYFESAYERKPYEGEKPEDIHGQHVKQFLEEYENYCLKNFEDSIEKIQTTIYIYMIDALYKSTKVHDERNFDYFIEEEKEKIESEIKQRLLKEAKQIKFSKLWDAIRSMFKKVKKEDFANIIRELYEGKDIYEILEEYPKGLIISYDRDIQDIAFQASTLLLIHQFRCRYFDEDILNYNLHSRRSKIFDTLEELEIKIDATTLSNNSILVQLIDKQCRQDPNTFPQNLNTFPQDSDPKTFPQDSDPKTFPQDSDPKTFPKDPKIADYSISDPNQEPKNKHLDSQNNPTNTIQDNKEALYHQATRHDGVGIRKKIIKTLIETFNVKEEKSGYFISSIQAEHNSQKRSKYDRIRNFVPIHNIKKDNLYQSQVTIRPANNLEKIDSFYKKHSLSMQLPKYLYQLYILSSENLEVGNASGYYEKDKVMKISIKRAQKIQKKHIIHTHHLAKQNPFPKGIVDTLKSKHLFQAKNNVFELNCSLLSLLQTSNTEKLIPSTLVQVKNISTKRVVKKIYPNKSAPYLILNQEHSRIDNLKGFFIQSMHSDKSLFSIFGISLRVVKNLIYTVFSSLKNAIHGIISIAIKAMYDQSLTSLILMVYLLCEIVFY